MARRCIIIVDGDPETRSALGEALFDVASSEGHQIELHEARNGGEALELARKHRPDLILMEVLLEGPHGLQVLRQLRKGKTEHEPPAIVLVTAMSAEIDRYWGLRNGAAAYIKKPWEADELRAKLRGQLADRG